jgi:hypothetical protein
MDINPALAELAPLLGRWRMELYGAAFLPSPESRVTGSIAVEWIQDGAALAIRQGDSEQPPAALWIIGRDESQDEYTALYSDDRGVSRVYRMTFAAGEWRMWRETPEFSQRFEARVAADGRRVTGRWERSADRGATWEHDFNLDYLRG